MDTHVTVKNASFLQNIMQRSVMAVSKRIILCLYTQTKSIYPPGSREGFGEMVQPSRECLPAPSSEREISKSQGTQGPTPGYHTLDPFCNGSVAPAVTEPSEEQ